MGNGTFTAPDIDQNAAAVFQSQGYFQAPQLIPDDLLNNSVAHMDQVIAGQYETDPVIRHHFSRTVEPGSPQDRLIKINNAHGVDATLLSLISYPAIGAWASFMLGGVDRVQVWHTQLLYKPPGSSSKGNIGIHQDFNYWQFFDKIDGILTAWIALSDVAVPSGAMRFVPGSHRWPLIDPGNFAEQDERKALAAIEVPDGEEWTEHAAVMPRGAVSFHHPMTFHGSGPNVSDQPRRSIAVHLCSEGSRVVKENPFVSDETLKSAEENPVIFQR